MTEIDAILQKYFQGKTSEEEDRQLVQWVQQSPENKKRFFTEKDIWDTYGFHSNQKKYEINPELELLKKSIVQVSQRTSPLNQILKIAAILLITFGLGWLSRYISFTDKEPSATVVMQEIVVPKGQINQVFLADGTRIWVNSGTRLTVPSAFTSAERVVKLNGEAYFEVAKDKKHPFRVEMNGQQIEVLGTSFNVRAYENSNMIETTLENGQVQLRTENQTTVLKPGYQSVFNKVNKNITIKKADPVISCSWRNGRFEFQNENLTEVFKVVERWYDVEITADERYFGRMHFSGVIKRNKDVKHFLEMLNLTIPIKYDINTDKITVSAR